jgi:hypothetical protein
MASRQPPTLPGGLARSAMGQFLEKQAIFNDQIALKIPSGKREPLLFFTIFL